MISTLPYLATIQFALDHLAFEPISESLDLVYEAYQADRQIFIIGNGGSASTASHFANDLGKGPNLPGVRRPRVMSLTDNVATMTAWSNDVSYDDVFVEQLKNWVNPGDVVIGISASGNSENVLRAIGHAKSVGGRTIGWCGFGGGKLSELADVSVIVKSDEYGPVEDVHLMINHIICTEFWRKVDEAGRPRAAAC